MEIDVNRIITLGNGESYIVITYVNNNNKDYYYLAECNEDASEVKENYKIVEAKYKDGKTFIEEVIGESNLKSILPAFIKNM